MLDHWTDVSEQDMFISAFLGSSIGTAILSADGRFLKANQAFCRMLGYSERELLGAGIEGYIQTDSGIPALTFFLGGIPDKGTSMKPFERRLTRKDGHTVWALINMTTIRIPGKKTRYYIIQAQDITDRKNAELAADRSLRQMTCALDCITDGFFSLDAEGRFTFINQAAERFFGQDRSELIGQCIWNAFPKMRNSEQHMRYLNSTRTGKPESYTTYYALIGKWLEIRTFPSKDAFTVYFRDVTDHKLTEETLRGSEELYRLIAEECDDMISKIDDFGKFNYVSVRLSNRP